MHKILGFITTIILMSVVGLFLVSSVCAEGRYSFLGTWGTYGSGNGQFNYTHGIAIDSSGNVYVADLDNNRIQKFGPNGTFIAKWGTYGSGNGQFNWPGGVAIDNSDNVYASDKENNRIQKFYPNGTFIATWGSSGSGNSQFDQPESIAVDNSGNVYVSDSNNNRIQKFDPNGIFITKWGTYGSGNGQFNWPAGIAVDNSGNVYVSDFDNNRIQKFDPNGTFITTWGTYGSGNGQFYYPAGIAVDNSGNVYVSDWENNRIQKFGPNGAFITKWGTYGSGSGQFYYPAGIAVNSSRDVYVADLANNRIQIFSPDRFADTPLDYWATPYIEVAYQAGYTTGYGSTGDFKPEYNVTRGQMAAFIIRALYDESFAYAQTPYFTDVPSTHDFFKYVQKMKDTGITVVTGTYDVDGTVTRGQMAAFIIRALYGESFAYTQTPYFTDVPSTHGFFKYVQKMKDDGITAVTGAYDVEGIVTRAQMAAFLSRAFLEME